MASTDYMTDVGLQHNIQEIEVEAIPVEIPCETVETTVNYDSQPMHIAIAPTMHENQGILLQPKQEIIQVNNLNSYESIPIGSEIYGDTGPGPSKIQRKLKKVGRFNDNDHFMTQEVSFVDTKPKKWEQKQVQIRTLEGEFSVTMWASGTDDGEFNYSFSILNTILTSSINRLTLNGSVRPDSYPVAPLQCFSKTSYIRMIVGIISDHS